MSLIDHPPVAGTGTGAARNLARTRFLSRGRLAIHILFFLALSAMVSVRGQILEYPLLTSPATPQVMVVGPDNAFWFTEFNTWRIGRIDTNGNVSEPFYWVSNTSPSGMIVGPDSNIWFTEAGTDKIARISPGTNGGFTNGVLTEFLIHTNIVTNSEPSAVAFGADGNLWFTEYLGNLIGVMNTNGQLLGEYGSNIFKAQAQPYDIAAGPDGNLWFTEVTYGKIGKITTNGQITEYTLVSTTNAAIVYSNSEPLNIIAGPDGAMWFSEFNSNRIGRITTSGTYTDFVLPTIGDQEFGSQEPYSLAIGSDGNIWFTEFVGNNISRLSLGSGIIVEFPIPYGGSDPTCIASGPDKNIWFGQYFANAVGEFLLPQLTLSFNTNSQAVLSWPVSATDYILQGNSNLVSTNWINLTSPPPIVTTNLFIYTNTTPGLNFFRLYLDITP